MPSEYSPWWGKARMTKSQIKQLLKEQEEARRIAEEKLAEAKKSEEWKKEQDFLALLEDKIETWDFDDIKIV